MRGTHHGLAAVIRRWSWVALAAAPLVGASVLASAACDSENACSVACPTGTRFTDDGSCACEPFDAGYCAVSKDCPDAYCPASDSAGACGDGRLWSTTICGCYPLPDGGLPRKK